MTKNQSTGQTILVVDDSPDTLEVIRRNLEEKGYAVLTAPGAGKALRILDDSEVDLVITDFKMPEVNGLDLTRHIRENHADTVIMMITGYPSLEGAVQAVKTGAEEYLAKPFTDEELLSAVERALEKLHLRRAANNPPAVKTSGFEGIVGESEPMQRVFRSIEKAAETSATVLIFGESGTGKELVARAIHYRSSRASAPFIPVNCSAIPEGLLESELFGYVKGAFTGAHQSRAGFFHASDQGSLFLDEISEMPLSMQAKLLRVLQDRRIYMLGSTKPIEVDVRILASTNKDLERAVRMGTFREDLFYRLNVISLELPPLRERENDSIILARYFAEKFGAEMGRITPRFTEDALNILKNYEWPGNVRELENAVQRMVVMLDKEVIDAPDLPSNMRYSVRIPGTGRTLADVEGEHILLTLRSCSGNRTRTAQALGIDRKTLREKLKKLLPE